MAEAARSVRGGPAGGDGLLATTPGLQALTVLELLTVKHRIRSVSPVADGVVGLV